MRGYHDLLFSHQTDIIYGSYLNEEESSFILDFIPMLIAKDDEETIVRIHSASWQIHG